MTLDEAREKLVSKKSADRLSATKKISKEKIAGLADELFLAYEKERRDRRTWEPQSEMIRALGLLNHKPALKYIEEIVKKNVPLDAITGSASIAFVQLKRDSIYDAHPVLELLSFGSISVITGALQALAIDKMLPPKNEIEEILKISRDINKHKDRMGKEYGLIDPRIYLAKACARWDRTLCADFLNYCIETAYGTTWFGKPFEDKGLIDICKKSLTGKYISF